MWVLSKVSFFGVLPSIPVISYLSFWEASKAVLALKCILRIFRKALRSLHMW